MYPGVSLVNKFGRSTNVDSGVATDIWDRANATDTQAIWIAPTTARTHDIASASTSDDGDPAGVGARTLRIFGLTGWGAAEVSEDITLNGTTNVATANAYIIIHRMQVLTKGATNVNVGQISATAQTDATVTAAILAGQGQTQMAIYGLPSTQSFFLTSWYSSLNKISAGTDAVAMRIIVNPEPDSELTNFLVKQTQGLIGGGASHQQYVWRPLFEVVGPAIIKVQGSGTVDNLDVSAGFDGFLVTS